MGWAMIDAGTGQVTGWLNHHPKQLAPGEIAVKSDKIKPSDKFWNGTELVDRDPADIAADDVTRQRAESLALLNSPGMQQLVKAIGAAVLSRPPAATSDEFVSIVEMQLL